MLCPGASVDGTDTVTMRALTAGQMRALTAGRSAEVGAQLRLELPVELVAGSWWAHRAALLDADPADP